MLDSRENPARIAAHELLEAYIKIQTAMAGDNNAPDLNSALCGTLEGIAKGHIKLGNQSIEEAAVTTELNTQRILYARGTAALELPNLLFNFKNNPSGYKTGARDNLEASIASARRSIAVANAVTPLIEDYKAKLAAAYTAGIFVDNNPLSTHGAHATKASTPPPARSR